MRKKLEDFPCPFDLISCTSGCRTREIQDYVGCPFLKIYEEYLATQKCARLLRVFERRSLDVVYYGLGVCIGKGMLAMTLKGRLDQFVEAIRSALKEAGL